MPLSFPPQVGLRSTVGHWVQQEASEIRVSQHHPTRPINCINCYCCVAPGDCDQPHLPRAGPQEALPLLRPGEGPGAGRGWWACPVLRVMRGADCCKAGVSWFDTRASPHTRLLPARTQLAPLHDKAIVEEVVGDLKDELDVA